MLESLNSTKNTDINGVKASLSKSGLGDLKNEIKQISENEIKSERPDMMKDQILLKEFLILIIKTKKGKD